MRGGGVWAGLTLVASVGAGTRGFSSVMAISCISVVMVTTAYFLLGSWFGGRGGRRNEAEFVSEQHQWYRYNVVISGHNS